MDIESSISSEKAGHGRTAGRPGHVEASLQSLKLDRLLGVPREHLVQAIAERTTSVITREENGRLCVVIKTPRLDLAPVALADITEYHTKLFGDPLVMEKFGNGRTRTRDEVAERVQKWAQRWDEGDPFSALAVRRRGASEIIGHIVLGYSEKQGQAELAYLFCRDSWGRHYGLEAAVSVVHHLAPLLKFYTGAAVQRAGSGMPPFVLQYHDSPTPGPEFRAIDATARIDNPASNKILLDLGMNRAEGTVQKHEGERYQLELSWPELPAAAQWTISYAPSGALVFEEQVTDLLS